MTDTITIPRATVQQALDALERTNSEPGSMAYEREAKASVALEDALRAAPQQQAEPVTCGYDETTGNCTRELCCHPTPPQRQWVGLTDEDYLNALDLHPYEGTDREFWNVLETKLKEKNT